MHHWWKDGDRPGLGRGKPRTLDCLHYEARRSVGGGSRASPRPLAPSRHRLLQAGWCPQEGLSCVWSVLQPESTSCSLCSLPLPWAAEAEPHSHFLSFVYVLKLCQRGSCPVNHHFQPFLYRIKWYESIFPSLLNWDQPTLLLLYIKNIIWDKLFKVPIHKIAYYRRAS